MLTPVAQTCLELVHIESVSRNEAAVEQYIRATLPSSFTVTHDSDSVILATTERHRNRDFVILAGHTDTVPVDHNLPGREEDGVLYGRGSADMKAGLAVMLELAKWIDEDSIDLPFDLGLLFFGREELPAGECPLLDALDSAAFKDVTLAILMEPTANTIEAGCTGNLNLTVRFEGVAAHSARPWQGENAINKALLAMSDVAQRGPNDVEVNGLVFHEVESITGIQGGLARNVIPSSADLDVNIRYAPNRNPKDFENERRNYYEGLGAVVDVVGNAIPAPVFVDHPLVKRLQAAGVDKVQPKQAWTNAADFGAHNIPAINFGPADPFFAHKQDEQVTVAALDKSLAILQRFMSA